MAATKRKVRETLYRVTTWDTDLQAFTPQIGVPEGPFTRKRMVDEIIPLLNDMGYQCEEADLEDDTGASPCLSIQEA